MRATLGPLFRLFATGVLGAGLAPATAQNVSLTPNTATLEPGGGVIVFTADLTYTGSARTRLEISAPRGWTYESGTSDMSGRPFVGAQVLLTWTENTARIGPLRSTFTLAYPGGTTSASIVPVLTVNDMSRIEGRPVRFGAGVPPRIVQQPASRIAGETSAQLGIHVLAEGSDPLRYQWRRSGVPVAGATRYSLGVPARLEDSGTYDVVVANDFGSVISAPSTLTVVRANPGNAPPIIDVHPSDVTVPAGTAAVLRVMAFNNHVITYQWQRDGVPIAGATNQVLVLPSATPSDSGMYRVTLANPYGSVTTNPARVTIGAAAPGREPPRITSQPASQVIRDGQDVEFAVEATGAELEYQWLLFGTPILGETASRLRAFRAGSYSVLVSNATGAVQSDFATLTVEPVSLAPSSQFYLGAGTVRTVVGGRGTLVAPYSGAAPHSYQWFKGDAPLSGATAEVLSFSNVTPADAGQYRVVVTSRFGSSQHFGNVAVEPAPVAPGFVRLSTPAAARNVGASTVFSATTDGTEPLAWQWFKNGRPVPGATSSMLGFSAVGFEDAGSYSVLASNEAGTMASDIWNLIVTGPGFATIGIGPAGAPAIVEQPGTVEVRQGARTEFLVRANSEVEPLAYQWRKDGVAIPGATGASYSIPRASPEHEGFYAVLVWNARGAVLSNAAHLTIHGRSFGGTYFGGFSGEAGTFAIHVRDDNSATILGHVGGVAFGADDILVDEAGKFEVPRELLPTGAIEAVIAIDGAVSGTVRGTALTLAGVRLGDAGATQNGRGLWRATASGARAAADFITGGDGRIFVLTRVHGVADAGEGALGSGGEFHLRTLAGADVTGTFDTSSQAVSVQIRPASGAAMTLFGGHETRRSRERLVNIATRGVTTTNPESAMTAGFVLSGTVARPMLIRGVGPALRAYGVENPIPGARIELLREGVPIATNLDWNTPGAAELVAAARRLGAFPLPTGSRDTALLAMLAPGAYTARVTGGDGIALVEVYDAAEEPDLRPTIVNIATRGRAGAGDAALIAGFVVNGELPQRVLIRGIGPGLNLFGVPGTLLDPRIAVFRGETLIASNDDWESPDGGADADAVFRAVGAFGLRPRSKDAALVLRLMPGAYSVHLSASDGEPGTALVEVYRLPGR